MTANDLYEYAWVAIIQSWCFSSKLIYTAF